jgi:hypothetical protein
MIGQNNNQTSTLTMSGGLLVVSSIFGTSFQPSGGRGIGRFTLGPGDDIFCQNQDVAQEFLPVRLRLHRTGRNTDKNVCVSSLVFLVSKSSSTSATQRIFI